MIKMGADMRGEKGFTLAEMLVAMVVAGLVMTATYATYMTQTRAYKTNEEVTALQQNLRAAMYFLERDLRMAGYNPTVSRTVRFGFTTVDATTVTFTTDLNENGVLDGTETITYSHNATDNTLRRDAGAGAQILASNITEVTLSYFDENGASTGSANAVRAVEITLTARTDDDKHGRTLTNRVRCRNMGL